MRQIGAQRACRVMNEAIRGAEGIVTPCVYHVNARCRYRRDMSRNINPFGLRMPPELRARLEAAATASGRSMNAELVHRLETSLSSTPSTQGKSNTLAAEIQSQLRFVADALLYEVLSLKSGRNSAEVARMKEIVERWGEAPAFDTRQNFRAKR